MVENSDDRSRRLLVLTFHFPPDGSVGGLRWAGMSKYLARLGWEVHVVTASPQPGPSASNGVHVHYCPRARTLNDLYKEWAQRVRSRDKHNDAAPARPPVAARDAGLVQRLRANVAFGLAFPDYGRGWIFRAARLARSLLKQRAFDAVVTSGPPHSAHVAGALACVGRPGLLWVDMRDPWAALIHKSWARTQYDASVMRLLIPRLERFVLRRAKGIVTNTAPFAEMLRATYPALDVSYVPNGIDRERLPPSSMEKFDGVSIAYAGTLYAGRDLTAVLLAISQFLARHPQARGEIKLRVAGHMDAAHESRFHHDVREASLEGVVETLGAISRAEALALIDRSHLAVVLAQDQPLQVPAKLYECVGMGVPTLVITESSSAAASEAERVGAFAFEPRDSEGIRTLLEALWQNRIPARTSAGSAIGYDVIAVAMDRLLASQ